MQEISKLMGENQFATINVICMDCSEEFDIKLERVGDSSIEIKNGIIGKRKDYLFKCQKCFDLEPSFGSETETYSRVVGYLRPIKNWNQAKKNEFNLRKTYKEPVELKE